jgi:hypothetical protein
MPTQQEEKQEVKEVPYTDEEKTYRNGLIKKLMWAQEERDRSYDEFDGMTYLQWYEANEKDDQSYIPPKKNNEDTRIVTGYTHEKDNTLLSTLLNYNLEPDIKAFDENGLEINELGEIEEDMVRKSRLIEKYNEKRPLVYRELLAQGTCFVEEVWVEQFRPEKDLNPNWQQDGVLFKDLKWKTRLKKVYEGAEVNLIQGKKVYLGNMRQFFIGKQPYAFILDIMPYAEAKAIYGNWERWEFVPRKPQKFVALPDTQTFQNDTLTKVEQDFVEVIKFQDKWANDFMILLNGVMMLPIEFPLTAISPSGEYTIAKGDLEPRPNFAISKSIPVKTKVDQAVLDEFLKLMILKTKASFKPPMANNTKRVLSQNIFIPGTITNDIPKDSMYPLVESDGVTPGEFSMYQLIKEQLDSKSVNPEFAGEEQSGQQTATEILENKKQQMLKLGLSIDGVVNLETQMAWLRLHTINCHWTKPIDKEIDQTRQNLVDVYRTVTVDSEFDGQKGQRIIEFTKDTNRKSTDIHKEEEESPKPIRKVYLHPELLRSLKAKWFIQIVPTEKNSDTLARIFFIQNLREAIEIFGIESINLDHAKTRYATIIGEDYSKFFNDEGAIQEMLKQMQTQEQTMGGPGQPKRPSPKPANATNSLTPREPRLQAAMEY